MNQHDIQIFKSVAHLSLNTHSTPTQGASTHCIQHRDQLPHYSTNSQQPHQALRQSPIVAMTTLVVGDKLLTLESLKRGQKKQQWSSKRNPASQSREIKFDEEFLQTLPVNPSKYKTRKTKSVDLHWVSVYLLALYTGDAIKGCGNMTSIWVSVDNEQVFAIRTTYVRQKPSTWLEHLQQR